MKFLRDMNDKIAPNFEKGGRFEKFYPLWELHDVGTFTPPDVTQTGPHVRDGLDLKRLMITVVIALVPCILMAIYNTGYQAQLALAHGGGALDNWQMGVWNFLGMTADFSNPLACIVMGSLYYLPIFATVMLTGLVVEGGTAVLRGHEVNEGFLVTGMLLPLTLPPTIPLWMVCLGMTFGLIFGKEVFGGTGMNFLNPALVARAFLFFAYPAHMSGESPWIASNLVGIDSYSGATLLAQAAESSRALAGQNWWDAFYGFIPGSMGETSAFACLIGCALLLWTRIGSGRTMIGVVMGTIAMSLLLNLSGSETNPMFAVPWYWHMVLGGWALGTVFMATDPVSSAFTDRGKLIYGFMIGVLCILIRVINPAYPEGMMLAILFMNMFAPLIDHFIVQGNIQRRLARNGI
jgi:Na+-transporting NADH:ubiquinone oxidoreductase subunit B